MPIDATEDTNIKVIYFAHEIALEPFNYLQVADETLIRQIISYGNYQNYAMYWCVLKLVEHIW